MKKNKPAFIYLGGSYPQLPGLRAVKRSGVQLVLVDKDEKCPGRQIADQFWEIAVDDYNEIGNQIRKLSNTHEIIGAYGVADYAWKSLQTIYSQINSPKTSSSAFKAMADKFEAKTTWKSVGVQTPQTIWVGSCCPTAENIAAISQCAERVVVKPVSSNNSKGVTVLSSSQTAHLIQAIQEALSISGKAIIEEYVQGKQVNVDGLMLNGNFHLVSTTLRYEDKEPDIEIHCAVQSNELISRAVTKALAHEVQLAANAIEYFDGPVTADCIVDTNGFWILEMSAHFHSVKLEGMKCEEPHPLETWIDTLKSGSAAQSEVRFPELNKTVGYAMAFAKKSGKVTGNILVPQELPKSVKIVDFYQHKKMGEKISVKGRSDRVLLMICWMEADDVLDVNNVSDTLKSALAIQS